MRSSNDDAWFPLMGFSNSRRNGKDKQPYLIRLKGGELFAFAGLWSTWRSPEGEDITSYTIMTTEPNALTAEIHNRMPVILARDDLERWLALDRDSADLLKPYPADDMEAYPVSKRVGNVRNNDAELIAPLR